MRPLAFAFLIFLFAFSTSKGQNRYILPCPKALLETSREILWKQVGIQEKTNRNDGKEIEEYLKVLNLPKGSPYCLAGQYYCFYQSTQILKLHPNTNPLPRTGLSVGIWFFAKRNGKKQDGIFQDDLVVWRKNKSIFGHTERIVSLGKKGWVQTIGFNTRKYIMEEKRWAEGVFLWKRNLLHPLGRMNLIGFVGFYQK